MALFSRNTWRRSEWRAANICVPGLFLTDAMITALLFRDDAYLKTASARVLALHELGLGRVQIATQQQRASVDEAVVAIELIAEGSRSVANTAQGIALAAARQGELAAGLAWLADDRREAVEALGTDYGT